MDCKKIRLDWGCVMNFYPRHLGDYAKDTAHLTMIEHGAYNLLLDRYYATEQPIPEDQAYRVARARTKEEKQAVDVVLQEFFTLVDGALVNNRADEELTKMQSKVKAAHENGKRGGRPKLNPEETEKKPTGFYVGSENETEKKAIQEPITNNQEPKEKTDVFSHTSQNANTATAKTKSRFDEFWDAYPIKVGKKPAFDTWKRKRLDEIADALIADVQLRAGSDRKWLGSYIPNPQTYLNQERWNDEIDRTPEKSNAADKHAALKASNTAAIAEARRRIMGEDRPVLEVVS